VKNELDILFEGSEKKMIKQFWKVLGIDPETTPEHLTLGEIGLESMFAVELQQELERATNTKISLNLIKLITIKMLKDYESNNVDNVNTFLSQIKMGKIILSKYKFIIPTELFTRLNDLNTGKPIYLMPPFEITFSTFEELAKKFNRPVIGLNWTKDMDSLETFKDITSYYTNLLKKLEPNGKYDLIGYFDGALVISKLLRKGLVNKSVIIDIYPDRSMIVEELTDDLLFDFIFGFINKDLPESFLEMLYRVTKSEPDLNSKIRKFVSELKDLGGKTMVANDMEKILQIACKRTKMIFEYLRKKNNKFANNLKTKIGKKWLTKTGKLTVIKPFKFDEVENPDELINGTRDFYFLPEEDNGSKELHSFEGVDSGNPFSITSESIGNRILEAFKQM
jgi:acyl carrier protein